MTCERIIIKNYTLFSAVSEKIAFIQFFFCTSGQGKKKIMKMTMKI